MCLLLWNARLRKHFPIVPNLIRWEGFRTNIVNIGNKSKNHKSGHCPVFRAKQGKIHMLAERQAWPWALIKDISDKRCCTAQVVCIDVRMTYLALFLVHHGTSSVIFYINQIDSSKIDRELHAWKITQMPCLITSQSTYMFFYKDSLYLVSICFVLVGIRLCNFLQIVLWDCVFFPQVDCKLFKAKGLACDFFGTSSHFGAQHSLHTPVKGSCEFFCILFSWKKVGPKVKWHVSY